MQIQDYNPFYYKQQPIMQQPMIPPPAPVRIEEILRLLLFVCLAVYAVCHMLFIPIEILLFALCHHDPDMKHIRDMLYFLYGSKYICVLLMFYCVYHHTNLWQKHHHILLYIFSVICLLVTGFFTWMIIIGDEEMRKHGFGPIYDHPFYYDFIVFVICGVQGVIYIFYLACTHPPANIMMFPTYQGYEMVPTMGPHAMRELQTIAQMDIPTRNSYMEQGFIPVFGSHAMRELAEVTPKTEAPKAEVPKAEAAPKAEPAPKAEAAPVQPQAPKPQAPRQPEMVKVPIYFVPGY